MSTLRQLLLFAVSLVLQFAAGIYLVIIVWWVIFGMGNGTGAGERWPPASYSIAAILISILWIAVARRILRRVPAKPVAEEVVELAA